MTDLLTVLEAQAWREYAAVADPAGVARDEAFMQAWERAGSDEELERMTAASQGVYAAVERPAFARYCAAIGRALDPWERESVRLAGGVA